MNYDNVTATEKIKEFTAVTYDGKKKKYKKYSTVCEWLDNNEPQYAKAGFTITETEPGKAIVMHVK